MARIKLAWDRMNIKHYDLGSHSSEGLKRLFNALQDRLVEADDDFKGLPSVADLEDAGLNTVKLQGDLYTPSKPWR